MDRRIPHERGEYHPLVSAEFLSRGEATAPTMPRTDGGDSNLRMGLEHLAPARDEPDAALQDLG